MANGLCRRLITTTKKSFVSLQTKARSSSRHVLESGKLLNVMRQKSGKLKLTSEPIVTKEPKTGINSQIE